MKFAASSPPAPISYLMRIGIMAGQWTPESGGGYTFTSELLSELERLAPHQSHEFFFLTKKEPPSVESAIPWRRVNAAPLPPESLRQKISRALGESPPRPARKLLLGDQPLEDCLDVIFFPYPDIFESANVIQISTIWDLSQRYCPYFPEISWNEERANREARFLKIARNASFLITGTERGRDELVQYYGVEKSLIRIIPHPTPMFAARHEGRVAKKPVAPWHIFYPAQFWPHKNHAVLLEAVSLLKKEHGLDVRLSFTGGLNEHARRLQRRAGELGISDTVKFLGFVEREELLQLYLTADALVYPSLFGPENLPPLEAFALRCPVIASDIPGAGEQLGAAACLVLPLDEKAWASAIIRMCSEDGYREELVTRGHERAISFTTQNFVSDLFGLFGDIEKLVRTWR